MWPEGSEHITKVQIKIKYVYFFVGLYYFSLSVYDFYDLISFFPFLSLCLLFFTSFGFDLDSIV